MAPDTHEKGERGVSKRVMWAAWSAPINGAATPPRMCRRGAAVVPLVDAWNGGMRIFRRGQIARDGLDLIFRDLEVAACLLPVCFDCADPIAGSDE